MAHKIWFDELSAGALTEARQAAVARGFGDIVVAGSMWLTPSSFVRQVSGHRIRLESTMSCIYPDHAAPAHGSDPDGVSHFESIWWHMRNASYPVVVTPIDGVYVLVDGEHRAAAAVLMKCNIRAVVVHTVVTAVVA